MSGEVVAISALGVPGLGGLAVLVVGSLAWNAVQAAIEQQRAEAERRRQEEKARLEAWHQFQQNQRHRMESLSQAQAQLTERLAALASATGPAPAVAVGGFVQAAGFVATEAELGLREAQFTRIERLLEAVPSTLAAGEDSPFPRLREQLADLRSRQTFPAEIETLRRTVEQTLQQQAQRAERLRAAQERLLAESEALLDQALFYLGLPLEESLGGEFATLEQILLRLLSTVRAPSLADLDLLQRRFTELKLQADQALERAATRERLEESISRNLQAMGYTAAQEPGGWVIPGGEQVRVAVQNDLRLGFQLQHERTESSSAALSADELGFLRRQEKRWCGDLKALIERLAAEGFQYQVQFERPIPEESVPIVVVEEVDDILAEEEERDRAERRHRSFQ